MKGYATVRPVNDSNVEIEVDSGAEKSAVVVMTWLEAQEYGHQVLLASIQTRLNEEANKI